MITVLQAAEYLLASGTSQDGTPAVSNLKLQKFLYYAQGLHLAEYGEPLFAEDFQAWRHGPVCPQAYHAFKQHGSRPIPRPAVDAWSLPPRARRILDQVIVEYGAVSAWDLRELTHTEPPWRDAYKDQERPATIAKASITKFFSNARAALRSGQIIDGAARLIQNLSFVQADPDADAILDRLFTRYAPAPGARRRIPKHA
jgi:uncharacterized phage-associated protein